MWAALGILGRPVGRAFLDDFGHFFLKIGKFGQLYLATNVDSSVQKTVVDAGKTFRNIKNTSDG